MVFTSLLLMAGNARAYDRMLLPKVVAMAQADAVVVAKVQNVEPSRHVSQVDLTVKRSLLGDVKGDLSVELDLGCAAGDTLLVYLTRQGDTWVALLDGTAKWTAALEKQREAELKRKPTWPASSGGWSAVFVLEKDEVAAGEHVNAWAVFRNTSDAPQKFAYKDSPPAEHTYLDLAVSRDGVVVPGLAHPHLNMETTRAHFAAHGNSYDHEVAPGGTFALPIDRLNSAEAGWGYKERLNFRYWPMDTPGVYTIVATDQQFAGRSSIAMPPVTLTVR